METQAVRQAPDQTTILSTKPPERSASEIHAINTDLIFVLGSKRRYEEAVPCDQRTKDLNRSV
jgi:hypothetical protein